MRTLAGYSDKISVCPGDTIAFKVSAEDGSGQYAASLVRLHCVDSHRDGPGLQEEAVASAFEGNYPARRQHIDIGSHAVIGEARAIRQLASFSIAAMIWPTLEKSTPQVVLSTGDDLGGGFSLVLAAGSRLSFELGDATRLTLPTPLLLREWTLVAATYQAATGRIELHARPLHCYGGAVPPQSAMDTAVAHHPSGGSGELSIAAGRGATGPRDHFNGKIDSPRLIADALPIEVLQQLITDPLSPTQAPLLVAAWDFSRDMGSEHVVDLSPNRLHGRLVNMPGRAMKGWNWSGAHQNWAAAPSQYGAIHFHEDDLSDCRWQTDFSFTVPDTLPSGVYAAKLMGQGDAEHIVFFVRAPRGRPTAPAVFLASTATYMAYANYRVMNRSNLYEMYLGQLPELVESDLFLNTRPEYGDSLYALHNDGSGMSIGTRLRPIVNMRPNTTLSAFNDDGWIWGWLKAASLGCDVITDEDLHNEGLGLLSDYRVVITGNHPEYVSTAMWDALQGFLDRGGRLMYLGGNGFFWRVAFHAEVAGVMELRRAEDGSRPWEAEPGEYYIQLQRRVWRTLATRRASAADPRRCRLHRFGLRHLILLPQDRRQPRSARGVHFRRHRGRDHRRFRPRRRRCRRPGDRPLRPRASGRRRMRWSSRDRRTIPRK